MKTLTTIQNVPSPSPAASGLCSAEVLLGCIWPDPRSRPSLRWLREQQKRGTISYYKIGSKVFFDLTKVRQEFEKFLVPRAEMPIVDVNRRRGRRRGELQGPRRPRCQPQVQISDRSFVFHGGWPLGVDGALLLDAAPSGSQENRGICTLLPKPMRNPEFTWANG
jgi:hypothetical protein